MQNRRASSSSLLAISAMLALVILLSGCSFGGKKPPAAFTPPPPQATPVFGAPEHLPDPPVVADVDLSNASVDPQLVPNGVLEAPAPPVPKPAPKRSITAPPPKPAATQPVETPTVQTPRLGQILSPEQTREYTRNLDESLDRVRRALSVLGRKNLTRDQAEILSRIQVFQKQAEDKRDQDLQIALQLARRADLLAKDLQDRVQ